MLNLLLFYFAAFYSCKNNHLILKVEVTAPETIYDIYAENFNVLCGALGAPAVVSTALGTPDVYIIDLDLSAGYTGSNDAVCGATVSKLSLP